MSHRLFRHSTLSNARVWDFLTRVDAAEAAACRAAGCARCGGALHSATYPRKPHGLAAALRDDVRRFSLCCAVCRRRVQPPSVGFVGRRSTSFLIQGKNGARQDSLRAAVAACIGHGEFDCRIRREGNTRQTAPAGDPRSRATTSPASAAAERPTVCPTESAEAPSPAATGLPA